MAKALLLPLLAEYLMLVGGSVGGPADTMRRPESADDDPEESCSTVSCRLRSALEMEQETFDTLSLLQKPVLEEVIPKVPANGGVIVLDGVDVNIVEQAGTKIDMSTDIGLMNDMAGAFRGDNDAMSGAGDVTRSNGADLDVDMAGAFRNDSDAATKNGTVTRTNGIEESLLQYRTAMPALAPGLNSSSLDYIADFARELPPEVLARGLVIVRNVNITVNRFHGLDLGLAADLNVSNNMSHAFSNNDNAYSLMGDVIRSNGLYLPVNLSDAFDDNNDAVSGNGDVVRQNGVSGAWPKDKWEAQIAEHTVTPASVKAAD